MNVNRLTDKSAWVAEGANDGCAYFFEQLDKRVMVVLRDNRSFVGTLRSVDHFNNIILHHTHERIYAGQKFCELFRGDLMFKGDAIFLCGYHDKAHESELQATNKIELADINEVLALKAQENQRAQEYQRLTNGARMERGLCLDHENYD